MHVQSGFENQVECRRVDRVIEYQSAQAADVAEGLALALQRRLVSHDYDAFGVLQGDSVSNGWLVRHERSCRA